MLREQCQLGMKVRFGRRQGETSLGEVIKLNPSKARVKLLERRGRGRGSEIGSAWTVPYSMMEPAEGTDCSVAPAEQPISCSPFQDAADYHILQAILCCYVQLSPENLSCDGELPAGQVRQRRVELERKLKALFKTYGREVSEAVVYEWDEQRRKEQDDR